MKKNVKIVPQWYLFLNEDIVLNTVKCIGNEEFKELSAIYPVHKTIDNVSFSFIKDNKKITMSFAIENLIKFTTKLIKVPWFPGNYSIEMKTL